MSLSVPVKGKIVMEYGLSSANTGSSEVQIAILTHDINQLTEHFKGHNKDHHSRRGLISKVNLRRKLLNYLKRCDNVRYKNIISSLNLRG